MPRFFEGKLPDLNFGTADGVTCAPGLSEAVVSRALAQERFSVAVNGRFKGGHITRFYGKPGANVHAIQLEMCQSTYMDEEAPYGYRTDRAEQVRGLLREMTQAAADWVRR